MTRKFFVFEAGKTCGARVQITNRLKGGGLRETDEIRDCDFVLALCPIVSRAGSDIAVAEKEIPVGKPVVVMVMHHTMDQDAVVPAGNRLVRRSDVQLTVDSLFHESKGFLRCPCNDVAIQDILKEVNAPRPVGQWTFQWLQKHPCITAACITTVVTTGLLISIVLYFTLKKD